MDNSRTKTREIIGRLNIPKSAVAGISGLSGTEVSAYIHGHTVSDANSLRIERATEEIAELITVLENRIGIRPDLKDVGRLREAIEGLKHAKSILVAEQQLSQAEDEVMYALKELAAPLQNQFSL